MDNENVICHIMGLNSISKKYFMTKMDYSTYDCIDLDLISNEIIKDYDMDKMYNQYENLKKKKNERYKDIGKKMTAFWEKNFNELINENIRSDKKVILIGKNHHYKQLSKKINLPTTNKFYVKSNIKQDIEEIIEYNLDNYRKDIIKGIFPIEYLNFNFLMKQKEALKNSYLKSGYLEKTIPQINVILNLLSKKKIKGNNLYISLRDSYNLNSKIHPKKNSKIFAYSEPVLALLGSFRFDESELVKSYHKNRVKIKEKKNGILKKLKKKRFLYLVDTKTFIPHEKGNNVKFFSQAPVVIKDKEQIDNVYDIFNDISVIE
jgi:hypothetical protein